MEETENTKTAVLVRGISKQYGKSDKKVLDNLDMTVTKGTIYGLLGASGSGKTTLLGAIVGSRKIQGGAISILGKAPGYIPVKSISYMPQEVALIGEFSVKDVILHQGWIFGMTTEQINERHKFLEQLLDLPHMDTLVKQMSGGQQRRLSLAVVLVQNPELLILDEPTVGLDPVLRQNLWDYLIKITKEDKKTVIITTHYIEEAKQAHTIGMLRNGKLLAEGAPQTLLSQFNCSSLENMFISLSTRQEEGCLNLYNQQNRCISSRDEVEILSQLPPKKTLKEKLCFTNKGHAKALLFKNFTKFRRHPGTVGMILIFPIIQIGAFFLSIGVIPNDMKIGVVNEELGSFTDCKQYSQYNNYLGGVLLEDNRTCVYNGLGCRFVEQLGSTIKQKVYYKTKDEGLQAIKQGKVRSVLYFPYNYSQSVTLVKDSSQKITEEDLNFNEINVFRDEIDFTLSRVIEIEIYKTFQRFTKELANDCRRDYRTEVSPIVFSEPVYGKFDLTYTDFIAPGMIVVTALSLALCISLLTVISERSEGIWERTIVSGVTTSEILIFHILTICVVVIIQLVEIFGISFYIFDLECKGDVLSVLFLLYLQSIIGVCMGILISVNSKNETEAIQTGIGVTSACVFLTGYFWPMEGMPTALRYISYLLPPTFSIESMNNIIHRGWGISNFHVFKGFLTSTGFICFFTLLSVLSLKFEKK